MTLKRLSSTSAAVVAAAAAALAGCLPASTTPMDAGAESISEAGGAVTYTKDVQPIFMAKCSPCHAGQGQGMQNIATTYADVLKPVQSLDSTGCWNDVDMTMPKKVGECALISIMNGRMPYASGCGAMPPLDPSVCVTSDQEAIIAQWVAAGMPQ